MIARADTDSALLFFREAELTDREMHELVGRLSVLAPDSLVQAVRGVKANRS